MLYKNFYSGIIFLTNKWRFFHIKVELHTDLERKLPIRILDMVDKPEYTYFPNKCMGHLQKVSFQICLLFRKSNT